MRVIAKSTNGSSRAAAAAFVLAALFASGQAIAQSKAPRPQIAEGRSPPRSSDGPQSVPAVEAHARDARQPDTGRHDIRAKTPEEPIDCNSQDVLGTSRIIAIKPATAPLHLGLQSYDETLALADHEVVLTFDDGPSPETTNAVLDALKHECVKATFFLVGRNAKAHPELVRRELREGHTVGHHSNTHPSITLRGMDDRAALDDIDAGIAAVEKAGYGEAARPAEHPHVPFFRFPGFADTAALKAHLDARHVVVFGSDLWAADWNRMTPAYELKRVMNLLDDPKRRGGIILFHDTRPSTATMLPDFLRALKAGGYRIVHLQPSATPAEPELEHAADGWTSETEKIIARVWPRIKPGAKHASAPKQDAPAPIEAIPGTH